MSNISTDRNSFFPHSKTGQTSPGQRVDLPKRNDEKTAKALSRRTETDAKVEIPEAIRDFARIKKAVDAAPDIDNSQRIAELREQINQGEYQINYDGLADKLLNEIV